MALANERCEQENVIEQLKNGVNAMRMPVDDLISNWAYMVMSALAWNLKSWYGLLLPNRQRGLELVRMEFRRFLHAIVWLPAQIVRSGRKIIYRIMGYNRWLKDFFAAWEQLRRPVLAFPSNTIRSDHTLCSKRRTLLRSCHHPLLGTIPTPKVVFEPICDSNLRLGNKNRPKRPRKIPRPRRSRNSGQFFAYFGTSKPLKRVFRPLLHKPPAHRF